eukprot:scaffold155660_cov58-Attheya_sp.AAC.2
MSHIFKDDSENNAFTGIVKTSAQFSFGGGCEEDYIKDGAEDMDGSIHGWRNGGWTGWFAGILRVAAKIEVATSSATASFVFGKIGGVTMNPEAHVTRNHVVNSSLRLGGTVVHGSQGSQGDEHEGVNHHSAIVEESAHNFLDSSDGWGVKIFSGVDGNCELLFGSIGWRDPSMLGSMLGLGWIGMLKAVQGAGDVSWEGHVDVSLGVVPLESVRPQ